ncbi:DNA polymerase III subunit beta [Dissulfurirhabdus thermomarina]|uniref:Beta sliding clamp n=1 Tax=Dissulfurirhabdus thermomarina TaxID=1765737 RepID=A0A6N9TMG0_DISTH|nr:DNA polymerase III subunit beta [Dissulfurirhabdus thermomarina]NDY42309.1 DNA polymerase III subunit beta [Dissulfurirhabdus thermomarina]NMX22416.1 DNA polymerase III subunit beta [Dissulfurirhabdus thermomarina]
MLRLVVEKKALSPVLARIQTIVDKKTTMNILNNVFLYTSADELFIEATDLEISYRGRVRCDEVEEQGAVTLGAKKFFEIVREFPSETIRLIEGENYWVTIGGGGKAEYRIGGLSPEDFPRFREVSHERSAEVEGALLKELLDKTLYSASHDESKYALCGVYVEEVLGEEGGTPLLRMVSSDGHRLSCAEKALDHPLGLDGGIILPRKGAAEIRRMVEGYDRVRFGVDGGFAFVAAGPEHMVLRLVDAAFPDYKAIIPAEKERSFFFDKTTFYSALKRLSIMSADSLFRGVKAAVSPGSVEVESLHKEMGEAREVVDVEYEGEPFEIAFNAKYIMDALGVMDSDRVELACNNDFSPCVIQGEKDPGFLALVMPMSLRKESGEDAEDTGNEG